MQAANDNDAEGDLLIGAKAIATFLGISPRLAYRLTTDRIIPFMKLGGTIAARRSSLARWMDEAEARATASA